MTLRKKADGRRILAVDRSRENRVISGGVEVVVVVILLPSVYITKEVKGV